MNKADAKRYACRMLSGLVQQHINGRGKTVPRDPLVYDWPFGEANEGRRLSRADEDRVHMALEELQDEIAKRGEQPREKGRLSHVPRFSKGDGKPGARWKGYRDQRKRQGYNKP